MTSPEPGRVLRRALLAWGLGHLLVGRPAAGRGLLLAEIVAVLLVAWLTASLASTSLYLVPYLAGFGFLVAWAWQAIDAYRTAQRLAGSAGAVPERSPGTALAWLSLPLLVWGSGFWLVGAEHATPAAALDRFVTAWTADALTPEEWPPAVRRAARDVDRRLGTEADRFRDVRVRLVEQEGDGASAVVEAIHYERRAASFLWVFPGTELVPVADRRLLELELTAGEAPLVGGGDIGAVRWKVIAAEVPGA
ncbi:MAG TPA: hypothetical protein VHQ42_04710 [Candidatus Limnocylindria bacterium]|nr:hypothetical protein [Candidatus Limnocylindria bacterium]